MKGESAHRAHSSGTWWTRRMKGLNFFQGFNKTFDRWFALLLIYVRAWMKLVFFFSLFLLCLDGNDLRPIFIVYAFLLFLPHIYVRVTIWTPQRIANEITVSCERTNDRFWFHVTIFFITCEIIFFAFLDRSRTRRKNLFWDLFFISNMISDNNI